MIFGNWYRPSETLDQQVALGVNFVVGYESGGVTGPVTREAYKAACRARGLKYLLQAPPDDATLALEAKDPYCLGWDQVDEPNAGQPSTVLVSVLQAAYAKYKVAAPNKIVLLNLDGAQEEAWNPAFNYKDAVKCCDWLMFDYYVRNRNGSVGDLKSQMRPKLDRFKAYCTNGQKFGFFIETDNQKLALQGWAPNGTGPSLQDVQDYFDLAKEYNCDVVAFFEDVIGHFWESYGATTPEMYALIKNNIAALSSPVPLPVPPPAVQRTVKSIRYQLTYDDGSTSLL